MCGSFLTKSGSHSNDRCVNCNQSSVTSSVLGQSIHPLKMVLVEMFMKKALFIACIANIHTNHLEEAIEVMQQSAHCWCCVTTLVLWSTMGSQPAAQAGSTLCWSDQGTSASWQWAHNRLFHGMMCHLCSGKKFNTYSVWNMQWIYHLLHHIGTYEMLLWRSNITFRHQQPDLVYFGGFRPRTPLWQGQYSDVPCHRACKSFNVDLALNPQKHPISCCQVN